MNNLHDIDKLTGDIIFQYIREYFGEELQNMIIRKQFGELWDGINHKVAQAYDLGVVEGLNQTIRNHPFKCTECNGSHITHSSECQWNISSGEWEVVWKNVEEGYCWDCESTVPLAQKQYGDYR